MWFGRYPGPNKFDGIERRDEMRRGTDTAIRHNDVRPLILNTIYERAFNELSKLSKPFITWAQSEDK